MASDSDKKSVWGDDLLDRQKDSQFLKNFLLGQTEKRLAMGRPASFVLNIDAEWGAGKSFFLDRFAADLESEDYIVARVNAWKDDYADDPYIAIMAALDTALDPFKKKPGKLKKAWSRLQEKGGPIAVKIGAGVFKTVVKKYVGEELQDLVSSNGETTDPTRQDNSLAESLESGVAEIDKLFDGAVEALVDRFKKSGEAVEAFKSQLGGAIDILKGANVPTPMFVLVDELDRCRPTYAIHLLERVKHIFEANGLVFVFATNTSQLQHSIAGAYGPNFDGYLYLKRFFDRTYVFEEPDKSRLIKQKLTQIDVSKLRAPENAFSEFLLGGFKTYRMDPRSIDQVMEIIDTTVSAWPHSHPIDLLLLFPLVATFYRTGKSRFEDVDFNLLDTWKFERKKLNRHTSELEDNSLYIGSTFRTTISVVRDLTEIMNRLDDDQFGDGTLARYVRGTFSSEWNGRPVKPDTPSVQVQLENLVANAGRMDSVSD